LICGIIYLVIDSIKIKRRIVTPSIEALSTDNRKKESDKSEIKGV